MTMAMYRGALYNIIHRYESGYCEIREVKDTHFNIILVKESELEEVE